MRAALFATGIVLALVALSTPAQASPSTCIGNPDPHSLVGGASCVAGEMKGAIDEFVQNCVRGQTLPPHPCSIHQPF